MGEGYSNGKFQDSVVNGDLEPVDALDNVGRNHDTDSALFRDFGVGNLNSADLRFIRDSLLTFDVRSPLYAGLVSTNFVRRPVNMVLNVIDEINDQYNPMRNPGRPLNGEGGGVYQPRNSVAMGDLPLGGVGFNLRGKSRSNVTVPVSNFPGHENVTPRSVVNNRGHEEDTDNCPQFPWANARNNRFYLPGGLIKFKKKKKRNRVYIC